MSANDRLLLDSILTKASTNYGPDRSADEYFELFAFDQILSDYLLSIDGLELGWVDGPQDGGIDGIFLFADGRHITEAIGADDVGRNSALTLYIVTARRKDTFQEAPLNALHASLGIWFDLERTSESLEAIFGPEVLEAREVFRQTLLATAERHPRLSIKIRYACRGDTATMNAVVKSRMNELERLVVSLFSNASVEGRFIGASELLELARKQRPTQYHLKFAECLDPHDGKTFVLLVPLRDYFNFLGTDEGILQQSLFEVNVRDYAGDTGINKDIRDTLLNQSQICADFWWLNNGITMLALNATTMGKKIILENPTVVNGLQTSQIVYDVFHSRPELLVSEHRSVLVKVIVAANDEVRDRIIKATNFQNPVALSSLRATDKIQRNIEHYLLERDWFLDRRPGYHRRLGRPPERIVSTSYLGAIVWALAYRNLNFAARTKWMRNDESYHRVFSDQIPLAVYARCLEFVKLVTHELRVRSMARRGSEKERRRGELLFSLFLACMRLGWKKYTVHDLTRLPLSKITEQEWHDAERWFEARALEYRVLRGINVGNVPPLGTPLRVKKFVNMCVHAIEEKLVQSAAP